jgi:hypothetical protein
MGAVAPSKLPKKTFADGGSVKKPPSKEAPPKKKEKLEFIDMGTPPPEFKHIGPLPSKFQVAPLRRVVPEGEVNYAKGGSPGLYANINARRKAGLPPKKPGQKGYPTAEAFKRSAKTAKK